MNSVPAASGLDPAHGGHERRRVRVPAAAPRYRRGAMPKLSAQRTSSRQLTGARAYVSNDYLQVKAEPITDAEFARRGERAADPVAYQLAVH